MWRVENHQILARQEKPSNLNASYIKKYSTNLTQRSTFMCTLSSIFEAQLLTRFTFIPYNFFFVTLIDFVVVVVTTLEEDHENKQVWINAWI